VDTMALVKAMHPERTDRSGEDHPLSLPHRFRCSPMIRCCYCEFESSENGVRAHIAQVHSASKPPRIWGRIAGPVCHLCGWSHTATDATPRDGWGNRRKHLERGKIVAVQASVPGPGRFYTLGEVPVPTGARRIKRIVVTIEPCHGPFLGPPDSQGRRYCVRDQRYHFVVAESKEYLRTERKSIPQTSKERCTVWPCRSAPGRRGKDARVSRDGIAGRCLRSGARQVFRFIIPFPFQSVRRRSDDLAPR